MKRMRLAHILFSVFVHSLIKTSLRTNILNSFGYTTTTTTTTTSTTTTTDDDDDNNKIVLTIIMMMMVIINISTIIM